MISIDLVPQGMAPLTVKQIPVGTMANFVYLVVDPSSLESLVVDSGWETSPILRAVEESNSKVKYLVATHGHFDHVGTLGEAAQSLGAQVVAHRDSPVPHDISVEEGDELRLGRHSVTVFHTPGHTPDSICLYDGEHLFTGDTLFIGTIGKFGKEWSEDMFESLQRLTRLPDRTVVYPGHDYGEVPCRTLGEEKSSNPFLLTSDLRSFLSAFA